MNKQWIRSAAVLLACLLAGTVTASAVDYSKVASASDMTTVEQVGVEGMKPILPEDVVDGVYEVEVESSSSMFKITKAILTVADGAMTAELTLSGTSYLVLYPGTGAEAAADTEDAYIGYTEDADGAYTYSVPVSALDQAFPCAAFSRNKEQWYDRSLLVRADSLPEEAVLAELPDYEALEKAARDARIEAMKGESSDETDAAVPAEGGILLPDGTYNAGVILTGGSGKASLSVVRLTVKDRRAVAQIEWSSPHYDYMLVDGIRYDPINTEGNSAFEVPVAALDQPLTMVADTTAMSVPHEIEYTLTFHVIDEKPALRRNGLIVTALSALAMAALGDAFARKERRP